MNRNQRNTRDGRRSHEILSTLGQEKVRHAQERSDDRRSRKLDFEIQKKRVNNEYFSREHLGRRVRSSRSHRELNHDEIIHPSLKTSFKIVDYAENSNSKSRGIRRAKSEENSKNQVNSKDYLNFKDQMNSKDQNLKDQLNSKNRMNLKNLKERSKMEKNRVQEEGENKKVNEDEKMKSMEDFLSARHRKLENLNVDVEDFAQGRHYWTPEFDETGIPSILQVQDDYFGDYFDEEDSVPKRRSSSRNDRLFTYEDLLRMKRDLEDEYEEASERREKREGENPRCNSDVTTLTVGCLTADRMEFQSDCVDDDVVTGILFYFSIFQIT